MSIKGILRDKRIQMVIKYEKRKEERKEKKERQHIDEIMKSLKSP